MDGVATLPADVRGAMFEETAARRRIADAVVVEKDFWVCWTLHRLVALPHMPRFLLKGGTSLSKCFGLIHRFSEDIDLGIEREDLGLEDVKAARCLLGKVDPTSNTSGKAYKHAREAVNARVREFTSNTLCPTIEEDFREALGEAFRLHPPETDAAEPSIRFEYPRVLDATRYGRGDYVVPVVRLELGARSDHEPVRTVAIRSFAADEFKDQFERPSCEVVAQAPERTLLEKALILHAANHRGTVKPLLSRHAYDLAMMARHPETMAAVERGLYERVAFHKFAFGENAAVRDAPRNGIRLVPGGDVLRGLEADYRAMEAMFFSEPAAPTFEEVLADLNRLQLALRAL